MDFLISKCKNLLRYLKADPKYFDKPIGTNVEYDSFVHLEFPRFTICFKNRWYAYSENKMREFGLDINDYLYNGVWSSNITESRGLSPEQVYQGKTQRRAECWNP